MKNGHVDWLRQFRQQLHTEIMASCYPWEETGSPRSASEQLLSLSFVTMGDGESAVTQDRTMEWNFLRKRELCADQKPVWNLRYKFHVWDRPVSIGSLKWNVVNWMWRKHRNQMTYQYKTGSGKPKHCTSGKYSFVEMVWIRLFSFTLTLSIVTLIEIWFRSHHRATKFKIKNWEPCTEEPMKTPKTDQRALWKARRWPHPQAHH